MRMIPVLALLAALVTTPAHAFTCAQVWDAKDHWNQTAIDAAMSFATKADIAKGKKCLAAGRPNQPAASVAPKAAPKKVAPKRTVSAAPATPSVPNPVPAPIKCYVIGDSIAVGTATAEGLPSSYKLTECKVDAKIGIPSTAIIARAHDAQLVVISAGSNDPTNPKLVDNLEAIRAVAKHQVLWIVPAVSKVAATDVKQVAAEHGDDTVEFTPGPDHTHPHSYAGIIAKVRADLANSNPVVAVSPTPAPAQPQEGPMSAWIVPLLAVFGALAFTYCVGKYGLVPVVQGIRSWLNSGKADAAALEARLQQIEQQLGIKSAAKPVAPVPPIPTVQTGPTGPTGG